MTTKRERAQMANHYAILHGKGPVMDVPAKRVHRAPDPTQPTESQIQKSIISFWAHSHNLYGLPEFALMAVPNGGARDAITGARLKAEGVRRGVPDLLLAVQRNNSCGLWIELKRRGGAVSPEQREVIAYLGREGYATAVCYSADEAREKIVQYLRRII